MSVYGSDLLDEKSLWQIYKECLTKLPPSTFNLGVAATVIFALVLDCSYFPEQYSNRLEVIRSLCDAGLGFGSTILGFLIAGFTIFSTLAKPDMLAKMYATPHSSGLSYLKVNFFAFVEVFVVYTFLLVIYLSTKIFGAVGGMISSIVDLSSRTPFFGYCLDKQWLINIWFVIICSASIYSLLALKSFIFNTYHAVMTAAVWSFNSTQ